jgi:hypothetical protein
MKKKNKRIRRIRRMGRLGYGSRPHLAVSVVLGVDAAGVSPALMEEISELFHGHILKHFDAGR